MRGLLPSKGLAHARSMALFSDVLSTAVGFSGAWGSCLQGTPTTTRINKTEISSIAAKPLQAAERSLPSVRDEGRAEWLITKRSVRQVMKCGRTRLWRRFLVKMGTQANRARWISAEGGLKDMQRQIGDKYTEDKKTQVNKAKAGDH